MKHDTSLTMNQIEYIGDMHCFYCVPKICLEFIGNQVCQEMERAHNSSSTSTVPSLYTTKLDG